MISSLFLHSESREKPLRIGVLVDSLELSKAFRNVLVDIESSDFARVELVILNRQPQLHPGPAGGRLARYLRLLRNSDFRRFFLYAVYQKLDQRHAHFPDPLEAVDCADILGNHPRLDVTPLTKRFVHRFPPEAVTAVRARDLDVLLRFGFNILRGEVLTSARCGIWSFHHGDNESYHGGPAYLWEVVEANPLSGAILQVLNEKLDDGLVLCKSLFATQQGLWRSRNTFNPYWGSTHFVIRKLHELHERGWETVKQNAVASSPYRGKTAIYRAPDNAQMLKWLVPKIRKKLIRRLNPFRRERLYHWRICLARTDTPRLLPGPKLQRLAYRWVPCPRGHFYADPFLLQDNQQVWLFFEDYLYGEKRGVLSCAPIQPDLSIGDPVRCIDVPYHVSYPHVFRHDGEVFMIPESSANESVELWRAAEFPFSWKLEKTLYHGSLVDSTPIYHSGRWYFFTTLVEPSGNAAFGALFTAEQLTGEWFRHPSTPISTDVRRARSAGAIQRLDRRLVRPVQDGGENYGARIHIQEILELTPDTYRESRLGSIEPDWERGLAGVHTYGYCAGIEVLDAVAWESRRKVHIGVMKK